MISSRARLCLSCAAMSVADRVGRTAAATAPAARTACTATTWLTASPTKIPAVSPCCRPRRDRPRAAARTMCANCGQVITAASAWPRATASMSAAPYPAWSASARMCSVTARCCASARSARSSASMPAPALISSSTRTSRWVQQRAGPGLEPGPARPPWRGFVGSHPPLGTNGCRALATIETLCPADPRAHAPNYACLCASWARIKDDPRARIHMVVSWTARAAQPMRRPVYAT